jgi:TetR/AcrR family transcriptional regulator, transcriptional repressor for nem operon
MARPLAFDIDAVTDRALLAFWQRGYDGCSITDLTQACGINRQSLYNAFTDKHGMFQAALARYLDRLDAALAPLAQPGAGLTELRAFVEGTLALQHQTNSGACLLVITAFSPHVADPAIGAAVRTGADRTRTAFRQVLLRHCNDPDAAAAYLYTVLNGLSALSRTGGSADNITATLTHVFATLSPKDQP